MCDRSAIPTACSCVLAQPPGTYVCLPSVSSWSSGPALQLCCRSRSPYPQDCSGSASAQLTFVRHLSYEDCLFCRSCFLYYVVRSGHNVCMRGVTNGDGSIDGYYECLLAFLGSWTRKFCRLLSARASFSTGGTW